MQINLQQRDILFALHPEKQSFLGINYYLFVARQYIYIAAKNEDPFCFTAYLKMLKNKLATKRRFETSLEHKITIVCCLIFILVWVYSCCIMCNSFFSVSYLHQL